MNAYERIDFYTTSFNYQVTYRTKLLLIASKIEHATKACRHFASK